jgi:hypothetical protein
MEGCTGWRYIAEEMAKAGVVAHLAEPADTSALRGPKRRAKTDLLTEPLGITAAQNLDRHRGSGRIGDLRALAAADRSIDLESIVTGTGAFSLIPPAYISSMPLFDLDHRPGRHRRWPAHLPNRPGSTR